MEPKELFALWAPDQITWSRWAAPVLFAQIRCPDMPLDPLAPVDTSWMDGVENAALILDVPGADAVRIGVSLLKRGYWPVPVINASPGAEELVSLRYEDETETSRLPSGQEFELKSRTIVDMRATVQAICRASQTLRKIADLPDSKPAFLVDAGRMPLHKPLEPGAFDNRWLVIPEDFPSARFLMERGIANALLVQQDSLSPQNDLAHVLLRWQQKGMKILAKKLSDSAAPVQITVRKPNGFLSPWYRVLARLGLRRNSAGGFGSYIPDSSGMG